MILTGDVEISPVVISHKGLTISTINPAAVPTPQESDLITTRPWSRWTRPTPAGRSCRIW